MYGQTATCVHVFAHIPLSTGWGCTSLKHGLFANQCCSSYHQCSLAWCKYKTLCVCRTPIMLGTHNSHSSCLARFELGEGGGEEGVKIKQAPVTRRGVLVPTVTQLKHTIKPSWPPQNAP